MALNVNKKSLGVKSLNLIGALLLFVAVLGLNFTNPPLWLGVVAVLFLLSSNVLQWILFNNDGRPLWSPPLKLLAPLATLIFLVGMILFQPQINQEHIALFVFYGALTLLFCLEVIMTLEHIKANKPPVPVIAATAFLLLLIANTVFMFTQMPQLAVALFMSGTFTLFSLSVFAIVADLVVVEVATSYVPNVDSTDEFSVSQESELDL